jgi:serine/threonine-protein kinase
MPVADGGTRAGEELDAGRYELHEAFESDELSESYRATDRSSRREVVVRVLRPELALRRDASERFLSASKKLAAIAHPNLPEIIAIESDETGIPFVVEERVAGEALSALFRNFPDGMPLGIAIHTIAPVAEAIAAAHEAGLVHGSLGCERIVLVTRAGGTLPKLLGAFTVRGAAQRAAADPRNDVHALGALLYEALCGEAPGARSEALHERAPHLPPPLTALVERCLARKPESRPASAVAVRDALTGVRDQQRVTPRTPVVEAPRPAERVQEPSRPGDHDHDHDHEREQERTAAATVAAPLITLSGAVRAVALSDDEQRAAQAALEHDARAVAAAYEATAVDPGRESGEQSETVVARPKPGATRTVAARGSEQHAKPLLPVPQATRSGVSPAILRNARKQEERRRRRRLAAWLFLLFALLLPFMIPLLSDHARAQVALGAHAKWSITGFTVLSVVAVIHTWALAISQPSLLLRPVTISQRLLTACVAVLGAGFFLPDGALGPAEVLGRLILPWASGGFYLFLTIYGLADSVARAADQAWLALVMALLYGSGMFGGYRAVSYAIAAQRNGRNRGLALGPAGAASMIVRLRAFASGKPIATASDAGVPLGSEIEEQHERGASESDDMRGIEKLQDARRKKGKQLEQTGTQLGKIAR